MTHGTFENAMVLLSVVTLFSPEICQTLSTWKIQFNQFNRCNFHPSLLLMQLAGWCIWHRVFGAKLTTI